MRDETEEIRQERVIEINANATGRTALEAAYGEVWDTRELGAAFDVLGFMAPFCVVKRRADGVKGSVEFQHYPRYYFSFTEDRP
ncbi:MAG: hypothetical protein ABIJ57_13800 [Pseudomonadota bacterium]